MKLYETLKSLRDAHQVSQQQIAEYLKVSRTTYANYEQGRREPDYSTLIQLARYFQVSTDYLLGIPEAESPIIITQAPTFKTALHKNIYDKLNDFNEQEIKMLNDLINIVYKQSEQK